MHGPANIDTGQFYTCPATESMGFTSGHPISLRSVSFLHSLESISSPSTSVIKYTWVRPLVG